MVTRAERAERAAGRRALIEAEDFTRARSVAVLQRGDSLALEDVARRPNAALVAGLVVALVVAAASGVSAYLTGRAPAGWDRDDSLVVDEASGARYVVDGGVLHPAPTLTGALLAGASRTPVLVPGHVLRGVPVGAPVGGADLPETPPAVPARPQPLLACTARGSGGQDGGAVQVWAGIPTASTAPTTGPAPGLLVSPPGTTDLLLVTGTTAFPLSMVAAEMLGYAPGQVRTVPRPWLDLFPRGVSLTPLQVPAHDAPGGVEGVGLAGEVVEVAGSGERLLVADGQLHPFVNDTSARLAPPPVREVSGPALNSAVRGAPVGIPQAPSTPPAVPAVETAVAGCAGSSGEPLSLVASVSEGGTQAFGPLQVADSTGGRSSVVWHQLPGSGVLAGVPSDERNAPLVVVSSGTAYPLADDAVLRALGLDREQALALPAPWLALAPTGATMTTQ